MQIEVDSHTHTTASGHAYSTLAENAATAAARSIRLLAITDHGPAMPGGPHPYHFLNMRVIPRVVNGVGILRGVEANILNVSGELDIAPEVHRAMDIILGGLHLPVTASAGRRDNTRSVINAIKAAHIDVFVHGGNPAFPIDADEIARAAADYQVLVEINNSSFTTSRPGSENNCISLAEAIARHGGLLTFGSDAHIASAVGKFDKCITLVEKIGFPPTQVLSGSSRQFLQFLQGRKPTADFDELAQFLAKTHN